MLGIIIMIFVQFIIPQFYWCLKSVDEGKVHVGKSIYMEGKRGFIFLQKSVPC